MSDLRIAVNQIIWLSAYVAFGLFAAIVVPAAAEGTEVVMEPKEECGTQYAMLRYLDKGAMARPTLSGPESTRQTTHFLIHWTGSGADSTNSVYVDSIAAMAEYSWFWIIQLHNWEAPPSDGTAGGGTDLFDIYVYADPGYPTMMGVAHPESGTGNPAQPNEMTSWISVRPGLPVDDKLPVTVAHEIMHAVQYSYDAVQPKWWYENCATWIEELVYNSINFYRTRLLENPGSLKTPHRAIDDDSAVAEYAGCLWPMYLAERHGPLLIRKIWENMAIRPGQDNLADIDYTLRTEVARTLEDALHEYAIWRCFTGRRALPPGSGIGFLEADSFPTEAMLLGDHEQMHESGPATPAAITGIGGCSYVRTRNGSDYIGATFHGDDNRDRWRVVLVNPLATGAVSLEHVPLTPDEFGMGVSSDDKDTVFLIATYVDLDDPQDSAANFTYTLDGLSAVPFTDGSPPLYASHDGSTLPIALPFTFCLYDSIYSQVRINVNGTLSFRGPQQSPSALPFPYVDTVGSVAPFWGDASSFDFGQPSRVGGVFYRVDDHSMIVRWDRVVAPGAPDSTNSFEAIISDGTDSTIGVGNTVRFRYGAMQWFPAPPPPLVSLAQGLEGTVGANSGDGINYDLIGMFGPGGDYYGGTNQAGGIKYLESQSFAWDACMGKGRIVGRVFRDDDQNCVWDSGEPVVSGQRILLMPTGDQAVSEGDGRFRFSFLDPNTYKLSQFSQAGWTQTCPQNNERITVVLDPGEADTTSRFGSHTPLYCDLAVVAAGTRARPGRFKMIAITVNNQGNITTGGILRFYPPPQLAISASIPPGTHYADSIEWTVPPLAGGAKADFFLEATVSPSVQLGDALYGVASVWASVADDYPVNNLFIETEIVTNSTDPNLKQVVPVGVGPLGKILPTDTLIYQIHFQNIGNDTAFDVSIRDTLDFDLDMSTLVPGACSHPHTFQIGGGRELIWQFNNINLPDSATDELGSQGFASYMLLVEPGTANGTTIHNRAQVYFDFNPPLATNTVANTIDECIANCVCHADPVCDNVRSDIADVVASINVGFRGSPPLVDADCTFERTDFNCDGVTDVIDIVKVIDVAFRGAALSATYCDPCFQYCRSTARA